MKANTEKEALLSLEYVRSIIDYDPITGIVTRKTGPRKGYTLGSKAAGERLYIWIKGRVYSLSRIIWFHHYGYWPKEIVDHKDENQSNNKIENLREATHTQNCQNRKAVTFNGGIRFNGAMIARPWQARISVNGVRFSLSWFRTKDEALKAYADACLKHHGEFANLGTVQ